MTKDKEQTADACREMKSLVIGVDPAGKAGDNTAVVLRIGSETHILRQPFAGAFVELAESARQQDAEMDLETLRRAIKSGHENYRYALKKQTGFPESVWSSLAIPSPLNGAAIEAIVCALAHLFLAHTEQPAAQPEVQYKRVGFTGSGSLSSMELGGEGHIWGNSTVAHPVPVYIRVGHSAQPGKAEVVAENISSNPAEVMHYHYYRKLGEGLDSVSAMASALSALPSGRYDSGLAEALLFYADHANFRSTIDGDTPKAAAVLFDEGRRAHEALARHAAMKAGAV